MKIPTPTKGADGLYKIRMRLNGKEITVRGTTAAECKREAAAIKAEHMAGKVVVRKCTMTVTAAIDKYISDNPRLSPSTVRGYRSIQRNIFPDAMPLLADSVPWQRIIDADTHAPKTIKNAWRFLCSVLRNIGITPPTVRLPAIVANERPFLQPEQIPIFLSAIKNKPCEIAAILGLHSLRRSEILDVTYNDIDAKNKVIHVRGAAVFDEHEKLTHKKENKNASSTRDVPIMIPRLLELTGDKTGAEYLVTTHPNVIYKGINRACKRNGLPEIGIHGLRHSFVSLAYHLGWSTVACMRVAGYSDYNTMRKIYTHLAESDKAKDISAMSNFFSNSK